MSFTASTIDALATAADLPERLVAARRTGRVVRASRRRFAPELSYGRHFGPAPATARHAAVVVLLFPRDDRWYFPLTVRPEQLVRHAGQISLPGGAVEPGESSADAAQRELAEELGVDRGVSLLATLDESYVYASDFRVTPWLAVVRQTPHWRPHGDEVQRILELPIDALLDDHCKGTITVQRGPLVFAAPCIRWQNHAIWGATAIILAELAELLRSLAYP